MYREKYKLLIIRGGGIENLKDILNRFLTHPQQAHIDNMKQFLVDIQDTDEDMYNSMVEAFISNGDNRDTKEHIQSQLKDITLDKTVEVPLLESFVKYLQNKIRESDTTIKTNNIKN